MINRKIELTIENYPYVITDLRVAFKVEKSLIGNPNMAEIFVYNLSGKTRDQISQKNLSVQLKAGYEDEGTPLIFSGQITNSLPVKQGPDWITKIYALDSKEALKGSVNTTLGPGATTRSILNTLVSNMENVTAGIVEGVENCLSGKQSLLRSLQLSGNIRELLDKLAKNCGFEYSVNEGVLETTQEDFALDDVPPFYINQSSGMIGSPEKTEVGLNVENLLLPALKLARKIHVKSISTSINVGNTYFMEVPKIQNEGIYRIDKITHIGDTHGNEWKTQIVGRNL